MGKAFRTLVSGLRAVLIARASIKSEFRIEQTMIRARGNNPLKFSAGDDDALAALLGTGRRTDMTAAQAVADALKDIRLHELAIDGGDAVGGAHPAGWARSGEAARPGGTGRRHVGAAGAEEGARLGRL